MGLLALCVLGSVLTLGAVHGYPSGTPQVACADMTPTHPTSEEIRETFQATDDREDVDSHPAQSADSAKFGIQTSTTCYKHGQTIYLRVRKTMEACDENIRIEGFFAQARTSASGSAIGSWPLMSDTKNVECNSNGEGALTHSVKQSGDAITLEWTAPSSGENDVTIYITILGSYDTFWVKVPSNSLSYDENCGDTTEADLSNDPCGDDPPQSPEDSDPTDEDMTTEEPENNVRIISSSMSLVILALSAVLYKILKQ